MGLFSRISRNISRAFRDVTETVQELAPIVAPIALGAIGAGFLAPRISGLFGGGAGGARGAGAVGQAALAGACPAPGVMGSRSPFANPIARAQFFPAFNPATIPARPQQAQNALIQQQLALLQGPRQQTTSFSQPAFGQAVSPSFRPFTPSFRSGQFGFGGVERPGISRGFDPQRQKQFGQFAPQQFQQVQSFQQAGFGGFGGFGGVREFRGFGGGFGGF